MHCNLMASNCAPVVLGCFLLAKFVPRMRTNFHFAASDQNSDYPDSLREINNLAITRRIHAVTLTFDSLPRFSMVLGKKVHGNNVHGKNVHGKMVHGK